MKPIVRAAAALVAACAVALASAKGPRPGHPLIGAWKITLPDVDCTEVYTYKADGTTLVTSAEEVAESAYEVSDRPDAKGFYRLRDRITKDNGKRDCSENRREKREYEASAQRPWPKLHILFPRKFSGMAAAIEIACAATFGTPKPLMSSSSIPSENRNAAALTAKKRTAWKPACPSRAPNVQWRLSQKLFVTATRKATVAATMWCTSKTTARRANTAMLSA